MAMREERPEGWGWEGRMGIWRENPLELVIRLALLFYFWWGRSSFLNTCTPSAKDTGVAAGISEQNASITGDVCCHRAIRVCHEIVQQQHRNLKLRYALPRCQTEVMRTSTDTSGWYFNYAVAHKAWVWVHRTGEDVITSLDDGLLTLAIKSRGHFLPVISSVYMSLTSLQLSHSINLGDFDGDLSCLQQKQFPSKKKKSQSLVSDSFHY